MIRRPPRPLVPADRLAPASTGPGRVEPAGPRSCGGLGFRRGSTAPAPAQVLAGFGGRRLRAGAPRTARSAFAPGRNHTRAALSGQDREREGPPGRFRIRWPALPDAEFHRFVGVRNTLERVRIFPLCAAAIRGQLRDGRPLPTFIEERGPAMTESGVNTERRSRCAIFRHPGCSAEEGVHRT